MKKSLFQILLIILFTTAYLQIKAQCFEKNVTFKSGENISFNVAYNWGLIWVDAGSVSFTIDSIFKNGQHIYHLKSWGKTYKTYDWLFKVRDYFDSYVDANTLKPIEFKRDNYEGGFIIKNEYKFDYTSNKIFSFTENTKQACKKDTLNLPDCTYDILTATYAARNIDFSMYKTGDTIPLRMIIDNEIFDLYIRYHGKEIVENIDGQKYNCIKFTALLVEGAIFSGGEDLTVWATDDKNKIPVIVSAKILVGYVKAYLTSAKNLRYKITSKLE